MKWGVDTGITNYHGLKGFKKLPESSGRDLIISDEDMKKLMHYLDNVYQHNHSKEMTKRIRSIIKIALFSGMRRGEILKLKWSDIVVHKFSFHGEIKESESFYLYDTKTGYNRYVPILPEIQQELSQLQRVGEYIFPRASDPNKKITSF